MELIFLTLLVVTVSCAPQSLQLSERPAEYLSTTAENIPIVKYEYEGVNPDGSYQWSYETGNGIRAREAGHLIDNGDPETQEMSVTGYYEYTGDDGTLVRVSYIANKDGFQPQSDILPTSPPIPPEIQRSLEWNAAHPENNESSTDRGVTQEN